MKYGIIKPIEQPKQPPVHECYRPFTWFKKDGTLYRCECGQVYRLVSWPCGDDGQRRQKYWYKELIEVWTKAGGEK